MLNSFNFFSRSRLALLCHSIHFIIALDFFFFSHPYVIIGNTEPERSSDIGVSVAMRPASLADLRRVESKLLFC